MLDTLLEIGKELRNADHPFLHHFCVVQPKLFDPKMQLVTCVVPVQPGGIFSFDEKIIKPVENRPLAYIMLKEFVTDNRRKYIFGDVFHLFDIKKQKVAAGNYTAGKDKEKKGAYDHDSLVWGDDVALSLIDSPRVKAFRESFRSQQAGIHAFLLQQPASFIHFDFEGQAWYELPEWKLFELGMNKFCFNQGADFWEPRTFLFKTLSVGSASLPGFDLGTTKQARTFQSLDQVTSLFYALKSSKRACLRVGDIKVIVLPRGDNLEARQIERFFEKTGLAAEETDEDQLETENAANAPKTPAKGKDELPSNGFDPTFGMLSGDEKSEANLLQFDFIFSRDGGTKPDVDLIEVSGLERSKLYDVAKRVRAASRETERERDEFFAAIAARFAAKSKDRSAIDEDTAKQVKAKRPPIFLTRAFLNIVGDQTTAKKKYQSHLLKVLPQIYTATYFDDPVLLPAFIEKIEFNIRNGEGLGFNLLKWDFIFLSRIQNTISDRLMDIQKSPSYQVGTLLGQLARGLRSKINSFDKNYAGLISRRIPTLADVIALHVEIDEKLIMHGKANLAFKVSPQLTNALKNFSSQGERYNKDLCAFGFFDSYFAPYKSEKEAAQEEEPPPVVVLEETETSTEISA